MCNLKQRSKEKRVATRKEIEILTILSLKFTENLIMYEKHK